MKAALATGVDLVVSRHDPHAAELVMAALGGVKADSIIETSGNAGGLALAEKLIRLGGKLSVLSLYGVQSLPIDIDSIVLNEIQITTGLGAANTYPRVLRMMQAGQLKMLPLQTSRPFDQFIEAIEDVANKRTTAVKTVVVHEEWLD
jgi:threonine dehydrogenase-like Zn-dependent dehydrogenase